MVKESPSESPRERSKRKAAVKRSSSEDKSTEPPPRKSRRSEEEEAPEKSPIPSPQTKVSEADLIKQIDVNHISICLRVVDS